MAYSMVTRSCMVALVLLAAMPNTHGQEEDGQCNTTLLEAVRANPGLSILATVIEMSGLSTTLNMTDNVTVLAPDNNAFNGTGGLLATLAANNLTLEQVTASGSNRAASILLYHVIPAPATAAELTNGQSVPTALGTGYNLTVQKTTTPTTIVSFIGVGSNATVVTADVRVCNSVVHVVNAVLLPAASLAAIPIAVDGPASAPAAPGLPALPPNEGGTSPPTVVPTPPGAPTVTVPGVDSTAAASSMTAGSLMFAISGVLAVALTM